MTADEIIAEVKQKTAYRLNGQFIGEILVAEIERLRTENQHLHDLIGGRS